MTELTTTQNRLKTQWTGQYGVASELSRRDYIVTFTLGNTPQCDLIAATPTGKAFSTEVKSQRTKSFWRYNEPTVEEDKYWIFVLIPKDFEPLRYFIMTSEEAHNEWHKYRDRRLAINPNIKEGNWGMNPKTPYPHEDKWDKLP